MNLLFLGDSITDCGHCFSEDGLGNGYVKMAAHSLKLPSQKIKPARKDNPFSNQHENFFVTNGGTDGFTFPRIYQKWKRQYSSDDWDVVSILGGVNEVGAVMDSGMSESGITSLLASSEQALYNLLRHLIQKNVRQILLPEPFLFPYPSYLSNWMPVLDKVRTMIRNAALMADSSSFFTAEASPDSPGAPDRIRLIPLQPALDAWASEHGWASVTTDGIHLTEQGHRIVCDCILSEL